MLLPIAFALALGYGVWNNIYDTGDNGQERETRFENPYYPVESGAFDHAWRHVQNNTFNPGNQIGKLEYANPLPYRAVNRFNDKLNMAQWGYAGPLKAAAINVTGQERLIHDQFTIQEHPRLDLTRQDPSKGRQRRRQWTHVPSD